MKIIWKVTKIAFYVTGFTYGLWLPPLTWFFREAAWLKSCHNLFAYLLLLYPVIFIVLGLLLGATLSKTSSNEGDAYIGGSSCRRPD